MECNTVTDEEGLAVELGELSISNVGEDDESQASTNKRDITVPEARYWSVEQVCDWLRSRGMAVLEHTFVDNDITGAELLRLDPHDVVQLIPQVGVRKRFEEAIEMLRQGEPASGDGETAQGGESGEEEGAGAVKLFVGQVPREATNDDLHCLMAPYGVVIEAVVLRDRFSGESRGCGFVRMASREAADKAITSLHNAFAMPPNHSLLQVQYARGESRGVGGGGAGAGQGAGGEHKLFVGQLPKEATEDLVREVFQVYGELNEVCLLRHPNGNSKGCCFVKFQDRESAVRAIQGLSGAKLLPGAIAPLNIEFAESKRDKWLKKAQRAMTMQPPHMPTHPYGMGVYPFPHQAQQPPGGPPMMPPGHAPASFRAPPNPFQMASMGPPGPFPGGPGMFAGGHPMYPPVPAMYGGGMPFGAQGPKTNGGGAMQGFEGFGGGGGTPREMGGGVYGEGMEGQAGWCEEGAPGCSVLVYNLHRDISDWNLCQIFGAHGPVVSAGVVVDRMGRSKGYGVVNFDHAEAAAGAVEVLNNADLMGRRIKVQVKMLK